jgi:flagellar protein FliL
MKKLFPLVLAILGCAVGGGLGYFLRPAADPAGDHATEADEDNAKTPSDTDAHEAPVAEDDAHATGDTSEDHAENQPEYVKLNNQFVVPVVENGSVAAMVILSLSLEVVPGSTEAVYAREPKLRDVFLQVLFDHANAGGFRGTFTDGANLVVLRQALLEIAQRTLGEIVTDVLIVDIARQDS